MEALQKALMEALQEMLMEELQEVLMMIGLAMSEIFLQEELFANEEKVARGERLLVLRSFHHTLFQRVDR